MFTTNGAKLLLKQAFFFFFSFFLSAANSPSLSLPTSRGLFWQEKQFSEKSRPKATVVPFFFFRPHCFHMRVFFKKRIRWGGGPIILDVNGRARRKPCCSSAFAACRHRFSKAHQIANSCDAFHPPPTPPKSWKPPPSRNSRRVLVVEHGGFQLLATGVSRCCNAERQFLRYCTQARPP